MPARICSLEATLVLRVPPPHQLRPRSAPRRTAPGQAAAASSAPPPSSSSTRSRLTPLIFLLPLALSLLLNQQRIDQVRDWVAGRPTASEVVVDLSGPLVLEGVSCPPVVEPLNVGVDWRPEDDEAYKTLAVERLQGAVRIPTESFDDMLGPEDPRFAIMGDLHAYFERTFPRVYAALDVETVAQWGLLFTWKGSDPSLKPVVLMAHQDVVPVNAVTAKRWTHPPFSGLYDEQGWIWGRGSADCKNTLVGALAAVDKLIQEGFKPTRSIIISSGADEEVGGRRTALPIARELEARYGKDGIALIVDEGSGGVDTVFGVPFARFGTAEKGAVSAHIETFMSGGHSSVPLSAHTSIGVLARCIVALEDNPFLPGLRAGSPMLQQLQCAADHGHVSDAWRRRVHDPSQWESLGADLAKKDPIFRAFLGTTQAVDLIDGGIKLNALPEYASAFINYRIDFQSSVNETLEHIASILEPVVAPLGLVFAPFGSHPDVDNNVVRLSQFGTSGIEPAPLTPTEGAVWELMAGTTRHVWPGAVVAPSGMIANTDTKHTWNLTRHIYRFVPASTDLIKGFHTVDERIHVDAHISTIRFYHKLLHNTETWKAP
ncbi:hypothetical protein JCM9279_002692 [Rhodotorula babjevae]